MPYVKPSATPKPERRAYPSDLTDAEWALLEPLLPVKQPRGQPRIHSYREIIKKKRPKRNGRPPIGQGPI